MKRITALFTALLLVFVLCACGGSDEPAEEILKIGVFEPVSGDNSAGGSRETLGIEYANSLTPTLKLGGVTYRVELIYADCGSTAEEAAAAAQELAEKGAAVVIGPYGSEEALAGGPVFEEAGIPVICASCTDPDVTEGNDYYFRICYTDDIQAAALAEFAADKLGSTTVYCLSESGSRFGTELVSAFGSAYASAGGAVVTDSFPVGCSDFTAYLSRVAAEGVRVVFLPVSAACGARILEQAAAMEMDDICFIGPDTLDDGAAFDSTVAGSLRLYVCSYYRDGSSADFEAGFSEYLNEDEERLAANGGTDSVFAASVMGYDAYNTALEAVEKAGSADKADILAILPSVACTGVSGTIVFDENGDADRAAYIKAADSSIGGWRHIGSYTG